MLWGVLFAALVYAPIMLLTIYAYAAKHRVLRFVFKPLVMPAIAALYVLTAKTPSLWVLLAMGFGWIGDIFLLVHTDRTRIGGILSFALGHICYILGLWFTRPAFSPMIVFPILWEAVVLVLLYCLLLRRVPKKFRLTGTIYCALLIAVGAMTLYCMLMSGFHPGYILAMVGAVLFVVSDSLLVYDAFIQESRIAATFVMVTYILAQSLLCIGFVLHGGI